MGCSVTIDAEICSDSYVADGTLTPRSIGFKVLNAAELVVLADGETQTLDGQYTLSGDLPSGAGIITPIVAWPAGTIIFYKRVSVEQQRYNVPSGVPLTGPKLELELDRRALIEQEIRLNLTRVLTLPDGEVAELLPPATQRTGGGKILAPNPITGQIEIQDGSAFKGNPGGNAMAVGPRLTLPNLTIEVGYDRIATSGAIAEGDGGGCFLRAQAATEADMPDTIVSADGRSWTHDDVEVNTKHFGAVDATINPDAADAMEMADAVAVARKMRLVVGSVPKLQIKRGVTLNSNTIEGETGAGFTGVAVVTFAPDAFADLDSAITITGSHGTTVRNLYGTSNQPTIIAATLVSSGAIDPTKLPGYSAFKPGICFIKLAATAAPTFYNCAADTTYKFGMYSLGGIGHVYNHGCHFRGWAGAWYIKVNSYDFKMTEGTIGGSFACVMFGNTAQAGEGTGGIDIRTEAVHLGFAPYGFYQVRDNEANPPATPLGLRWHAYGPTSKEQIGEAIVKTLPESILNEIDDDAPYFSWGAAAYQLPDAIVAAGRKQRYAFDLGSTGVFRIKHPGAQTGSGSYAVSPNYIDPGNAPAAIAHFATLAAVGNNAPVDLESIGNSFILDAPLYSRDFRHGRLDQDYQRRSERARATEFTPRTNLLLDPLQQTTGIGTTNNALTANGGSWTISGTGSDKRLTIADAATFGGAAAIDNRILAEEFGSNPPLLQMLDNSGLNSLVAQIPFRNAPVALGIRTFSVSFWFKTASANFQPRVAMSGGGFAYSPTLVGNGKWQKVVLTGYLATDAAGDGLTAFQIVRAAAGGNVPVYFTPPMICFDDIAPFSRWQMPAIKSNLMLDGFTVDTSDATWDYVTVNINGGARKIPVKKA